MSCPPAEVINVLYRKHSGGLGGFFVFFFFCANELLCWLSLRTVAGTPILSLILHNYVTSFHQSHLYDVEAVHLLLIYFIIP